MRQLFIILVYFSFNVYCLTAQQWVPSGASMTINPTQTKVGIGTTSPKTNLHVEGNVYIPMQSSYWIGATSDAGNRLRMHHTGSGAFIDYYPSLTFRAGTSTIMTLTSDLKVGLGVSSPTEKLDINGSLKVRGVDFVLGTESGRPQGSKLRNRALVHSGVENKDELVVNFDGDFEDGVRVQGPKLGVQGYLGIATMSPTSALQINAEGDPSYIEGQNDVNKRHGIQIWGLDQALLMGVNTEKRISYLQSVDVWNWPSNLVLNQRGGCVNIGNVDVNQTAGYIFAVAGNMIAERYVCKLKANWPDYVFSANNYSLMPLKDLENYVRENKHLPEIPSEQEVQKNGIDMAEMTTLLLKKVEELTLYIIEQNKEIESLKCVVDKLKN
ncbi:MAG: hypothetical protein IPO21_00815 [Bacteroidales bacterium]|nr:hypothetical protein [Bacteroidales bacterium]